ncbi:hypothetical protein TL16_g02366 [Triparma laevis f. inornata]|uniref:folate gamma-glutamyl hydrolase n=1 Tax=Triparma laevis f. inornata TaxID=1714386 RepID=A0A9W6ZWX1_9STRA|nr:hypothetical protein TL16_g02366 [Triparma laevis f. inornata]
MSLIKVSLAIAALPAALTFSQVYDQPVIGILTFPYTSDTQAGSPTNSGGNALSASSVKFAQARFDDAPNNAVSYFDASYAQWLGQGGARIVPVPYDIDEGDLEVLFGKLNGVLFTGGPATPESFPEYFVTAGRIYDLVVTNGDGDVPLWGTCLGFETISSIVAGGEYLVLTDFDAEQISLPLSLTNSAPNSRVFGSDMPSEIKSIFTSQNVTTNWHTYGVGVDNFKNLLSSELIATSTNFDRGGLEFVSSMEHVTAPIYATQWHPESNQFDTTDKKGDPTPNRSADANKAMAYLSSRRWSRVR